VVAENGSIICAAECREGLPEHGSFSELLRARDNPAELLEMIDAPGFAVPDQWQVQVQALVQRRATIYLKSDGLTAQQLAESHLLPADDVSETISRTLAEAGDTARLCVLPQGPQTIPYLA
jgi:nickel-dependent lactate racemase